MESGMRQQTLSRWLQDACSVPVVPSTRTHRKWGLDDKLRILTEAYQLTGTELTRVLEREGVVLAECEQWRLALADDGRGSMATTRRIRALERELARKDKALAEAAALLVLKKKVAHRWEAADDDTSPEAESSCLPPSLRPNGAVRDCGRCMAVGISPRTVERWRHRPNEGDGRRGPRHRSGNALTPGEEDQVRHAPHH
jgi:hypothetical protein